MRPLSLCPNPAHQLWFVDGGASDRVEVRFDPALDPGGDERCRLRFVLPQHVHARRDDDGAVTACVGDTAVARVRDGTVLFHRPLTAFAARFLADNGVPLGESPTHGVGAVPPTCTDLHTHFAAALPGVVLVDLARAAGITVSSRYLQGLGIGSDVDVDVGTFDDDTAARVANQLDLPVDRQVPFREMQARYQRREPFTKHPDLFVPQLEAIAARAAASGCRVLELSLFDILGVPGRLALAHAHLPRLEAEHGVALRFLFALHREDDLEWDLDMVERLRLNLGSRAIAGVDFMGHERTSTRAFSANLLAVAALAPQRPGLVVRVHAGENPAHPENVRVAVETLLPAVLQHGLELRIGHGLYGVDDDLMALMARWSVHRPGFLDDEPRGRVVIEFNLTSNLALNNIQSPLDVTLRRCLDAGVDVVLATDGAGLYRTCLADEAAAARACGVTTTQLEHMAATEALLLARKAREEALLPSWSTFSPPAFPPLQHYTRAFQADQAARAAAQASTWEARMGALALPLMVSPPSRADRDEGRLPGLLLSFIGPRRVLVVSGAWRHAFSTFDNGDVARVRAFFAALLPRLGRDVVVVTGGTSVGVEGLVHEVCAGLAEGGVAVPALLGVGVTDLDPALVDERLDGFWRCTDTLYDKQQPLFSLAQTTRAAVLFVGGGPIVLDEVQAAQNHGLRFRCVSDVPGSSRVVAALQPGRSLMLGDDDVTRGRAVDDVLALVVAPGGPGRLRHPGANDAVDVVVQRTGARGVGQLLLITRHADAGAEGGRFALPGGFMLAGEAPVAAARRVVREETGLSVDDTVCTEVAVVEGGGRDPRDTAERWVRSHVVRVDLPPGPAPLVQGRRGAIRAFFVDVDRVPGPLAFDHDDLVRRALNGASRSG